MSRRAAYTSAGSCTAISRFRDGRRTLQERSGLFGANSGRARQPRNNPPRRRLIVTFQRADCRLGIARKRRVEDLLMFARGVAFQYFLRTEFCPQYPLSFCLIEQQRGEINEPLRTARRQQRHMELAMEDRPVLGCRTGF